MLCGRVKSMKSLIKSQTEMHAPEWIHYDCHTRFENNVTNNQFNARAIKPITFHDL